MRRALTVAWIAVWLLGAALSGWLFYDQYWRWRGCFNDQGRCFDPAESVVYLEQSGEVWGLSTAACLLLGLLGAIVAFRRQKPLKP
jgi:hypothetical protein